MFKTTTGSTAYLKIAAQKKKRTEVRAKFRRRLSPWTSEGPLLISEPQQSTRQRKRYRSKEMFKPHALWKNPWRPGLGTGCVVVYHHELMISRSKTISCISTTYLTAPSQTHYVFSDFSSNFWLFFLQTLRGSFSAVSTPIFSSKY